MSLYAIALRALLEKLWEHGGRQCGICKSELLLEDGQIDHIIPKSAGGLDEIGNLQAAHRSCNIRKGGVDRISASGPPIEIPYYHMWEDVPTDHRVVAPERVTGCQAAIRTAMSKWAPYRRCRGSVTLEGLCWTHWQRAEDYRVSTQSVQPGELLEYRDGA